MQDNMHYFILSVTTLFYEAMTRFLIPLGVDSSFKCFELYFKAEIRFDVLDCSC